MTLHVPSAAASAVQALEQQVQSLPVWVGCVHGLTRAEAAVVASPPFQRLRRLRQMGLAFHAFPNAENTRASHSLGVAYWADAHLRALFQAEDAGTKAQLIAVGDELGDLSLALVVRLFALLHDIDLFPLGHTLRYQSGLFSEAKGRPRLSACVAAIKAYAAGHAFQDAPTPGDRKGWLLAFDRHLDAAAAALGDSPRPYACLARQLVNSSLGADLIDFALRDSFAIARDQWPPVDLPRALRLAPEAKGWVLALEGADGPAMDRAVAIADDLYRARFEVFATSVFNGVKLAADAMLDFVLRRLGAAAKTLLPEDRLLAMGDDELIDQLAAAESEVARDLGLAPIAAALKAGSLHEEIWRSDDLAAFRRRPDADKALALAREWRAAAERALGERLPWAQPGDVIVAISPETMQAKPPDAWLSGPGGMFTLAQALGRGHAAQAVDTFGGYVRLWSLRVYLAPARRGDAPSAAAAAESLFGGGG
ncbi:MAG: hypothetical protein ACHP84_03695 [Caulobacterales bacterium]